MSAADGALVETVARLAGVDDLEVVARTRTLTSLIVRVRPRDGGLGWFAKACPPDPAPAIASAHRAEHDFYTRVLPLLEEGEQIAPPFVGADAPAVLVLADLSDGWSSPPYPMPGRPLHVRAALAALARLHRAGLTALEADRPIAGERVAEEVELEAFLRRHRQFLPAGHVRRLERAHALLARRRATPRATLLQGDAHPANMLFCATDPSRPAILCDWQHWQIGSPGHDLATLLGLHGRGSAGRPLSWLRRYADLHVAGGTPAWTLEELIEDYRWSVLRLVATVPAWQASIGLDASIWWPLLDRGMRAWTEARCDALG